MLLFVPLFIIHACIAGTIPATPENITITFLTPTSVRISWQTMLNLQKHPIEKYVVTYKPTDDRVVQQVAGNSEALVLDRLQPNTQYQITVSAIWSGKKYRSRQVIFRTLDLPRNSLQQDQGTYFTGTGAMAPHGSSSSSSSSSSNSGGSAGNIGILTDDVPLTISNSNNNNNLNPVHNNNINSNNNNSTHPPTRELPPIRGVEVGIVLIVLLVWAGAIALFFNRWGKIRMLLPYQPDYKQEQLKVPGTGVCTGSVCNGQHSHQNLLQPDLLYQCEGSEMGTIAPITTLPIQTDTVAHQHFHYLQDEPSTTISERCTRSRINSAIFVSSEGRGFDSIEFLRRHGSQSVLCRKARSAENISDDDRKRRFSDNRQWSAIDNNNDNNSNNKNNNQQNETIELAECHMIPSSVSATASPLKNVTNNNNNNNNTVPAIVPSLSLSSTVSTGGTHTATVTTSNTVIVGSISIETPPLHIQQQQNKKQKEKQQQFANRISTTATSSTKSQSPIPSRSNSPVFLSNNQNLYNMNNRAGSTATILHNSSTSLPQTPVHFQYHQQQQQQQPQQSGKLRSPKLTNLPTLSISGPSPPHEEEFL